MSFQFLENILFHRLYFLGQTKILLMQSCGIIILC